jgi:HSP20 family molecular chaperone IbpA
MTNHLANRVHSSLVPRREDFFGPFESFFNDVFDEMFGNFSGLKSYGKKGFPVLDVLIDGGKWIIECSVPGVRTEDLKVEIDPPESKDSPKKQGVRLLTISGHMEQQYSEKAEYHKKELRRSSFERSLYLPDYIEGEPEATLKNGILRLVWDVPQLKMPEKQSIPIKNLD